MNNELIFITSLSSLEADSPVLVKASDKWFIVVRSNGKTHVYDGVCPHLDFPLTPKTTIVTDCTIICKAHFGSFNSVTGESLKPQITPNRLSRLHPIILGNDVFIKKNVNPQ